MAPSATNAVRRIPRGAARRKELAAVAERVFLKHGFADTTMQMIASEAGGSKETLYRHFESKEALFAELVGERASAIAGPESALARDEPPEKALYELGLKLLRLMTAGDNPKLFNIVVAEAHRAPDLAAIFYTQGPGATLGRLTEYLRLASLQNRLRCDDPLRAARLFLGAVISHYHLHCLIGQPPKALTEHEIRKHVTAAVAMFLSHYGSIARSK